MRDVLAVWRNTRSIVLVALSAGVYAAVLIPFKAIPLIPGITEIRPANAIPPVLSLLFGPPAAWGCAIGNLIGDFFGTIGPGSAFGFVGNFLLGYLPYRLWKAWAPRWRANGSAAQLPLFWLVTIIASCACALVIGFGVQWLQLAPYQVLFPLISLNNALMGVVLGPVLLALLYRRAERWGLLAEQVHHEDDLRNGALAPAAGLVVLLACAGGWVVLRQGVLDALIPKGGATGDAALGGQLTLASAVLSVVMLAATALLARFPKAAPAPEQVARQAYDPRSPALDVQGVRYRYRSGSRPALQDLSVRIEPGTFAAVMGRTAAGKSTLCRCANGLVPQFYGGDFAGAVSAFGVPVSRVPVQDNAGLVGVVFQDFDAQLISSDVSLEVAFAMENLGLPREEMQARVADTLARVGLTGFERRDPETLSGGEKQRLAIASVLAARPRLLVLDEPTTDLDPQGKAQVFSAARDLVGEGLTVLMAEHEPDHALAADRVVALAEGQVAYDGPSEELLNDAARCLALGIRPPEIPACFAAVGAEQRPTSVAEAVEVGREIGLRLDGAAFAEVTAGEVSRAASYGEPIIEVYDLVHEYTPGIGAVAGVSLTIRQGEFVALLGQNGSGKTTLAKHLNGLLEATRGSVSVLPPWSPFLQKGGDGNERTGGPPVPLQVGHVFQDPDHQIFCATVRDEVAFGPKTLGLDLQRVDEALGATGLSDLADADPFTLTKGERQAVAVASALACDPQVLVLDEPTTGLDGPQQERMMGLLRDLNEHERTIIIITHSMWAAAAYAHRVVVMTGGKVIADAPTREAFGHTDALAQAHLRPTATTELSQALFGVTLLSPEEFGRVVRTAG